MSKDTRHTFSSRSTTTSSSRPRNTSFRPTGHSSSSSAASSMVTTPAYVLDPIYLLDDTIHSTSSLRLHFMQGLEQLQHQVDILEDLNIQNQNYLQTLQPHLDSLETILLESKRQLYHQTESQEMKAALKVKVARDEYRNLQNRFEKLVKATESSISCRHGGGGGGGSGSRGVDPKSLSGGGGGRGSGSKYDLVAMDMDLAKQKREKIQEETRGEGNNGGGGEGVLKHVGISAEEKQKLKAMVEASQLSLEKLSLKDKKKKR